MTPDSTRQAAATDVTAVAANSSAADEARLGVELGDERWLVALADVAEVITLPPLTEVPFTRPWFLGVTSVRGNPFGVVDLAAFFGAARVELGEAARLLVLAADLRMNSALLVSRVLGLQPVERFVREPQPATSAPWSAARFRDPGGGRWTALDLRALVAHPDFIRIEASPAS